MPEGARLLIDEALDELLPTTIDEALELLGACRDDVLLGAPLDIALELSLDADADEALEPLTAGEDELLPAIPELLGEPRELLLRGSKDELEGS